MGGKFFASKLHELWYTGKQVTYEMLIVILTQYRFTALVKKNI